MSTFTILGLDDVPVPHPARIKELVSGNEQPLPVEKEYLGSVLRQGPSALSTLDTQISQGHEALISLQRQRKEAEAIIRDAQFILHPIRSICSEILLEIFSWCVYDAYNVKDVSKTVQCLNPRHPPWTISHVSRRWRNITLACSMLWSNIALDLDQYEVIDTSDRVYMFQLGLYLNRSRGCDLSVSLCSDYCLETHPVMGLLEAGISQWRNLNIGLCPSTVKTLGENVFPLLRRLEVTSFVLFQENEKTVLTAPELRIFISRCNDMACSLLGIPWKQLEMFSCCNASNRHCVEVLRQLSSAKSLNLTVHKMNNLDLADGAIVIPFVKTLEFEERKCEGVMARLLNSLTLPSITFLSLTFPKLSVSTFPTTFDASTTLTSLSINCDLSHANNSTLFLVFLKSTPNVTVLRLSAAGIPNNVLHGLTLMEGKDSLLPSLLVLKIAPGVPLCEVKLFIGMLESRCTEDEDDNKKGSGSDSYSCGSIQEPLNEETSGRRKLKQLRFQQPELGELRQLNSEDQRRWDTLCSSLEILYNFESF
ncbi:hypothetical protein ARMSODRAFT_1025681 [Armillaria solidipes]|uniref:F-box domain-containing protein n=1 Tax=Armillaria solidipes TaxID=1076256 RepID=A0A2H3BE84_9AGAR|nr:hypothetical protein ARMSODRAFT_1025681 [Armillaria solidipes]